jgi:hypothetical protein
MSWYGWRAICFADTHASRRYGPGAAGPIRVARTKKSAAYRFAIAALPGRVEDSPGPRKISISVHSQADGNPDLNDHSSSRQNSPSNVQ